MWLGILAAIALFVGSVPAVFGVEPRVQVELLSETRSLVPGQTSWIALRQRIAPGWHTYWMNPGDSGEPIRVEWSLPAGFAAGEIDWPHPERIAAGIAMSYGYSNEVVLPISLTVPAGATPGTEVTLRGQASWLVCEKTCIPEEAPVALTLPVTRDVASPDPRGAPLIAAARRAAPTASPWPASFVAADRTVTFTVAARDLVPERIEEVWFYPARWGAIEHAAVQRATTGRSGITLTVERGPLPEALTAPIEGVLVVSERLDGGVSRQAFSVRAQPATGQWATLLRALALALAGGLVLNLMPCVLPVLSVKALGLVDHAGAPASSLRRHGLAYLLGVLVSFAAVAGALLALRAGGARLGWGFQLQSPGFVTVLALVLWALALSLSGMFTIGARWTGTGQSLASRGGYAGSFFTGALATVAATPCTAPFMGVAVGYAVTQPWPRALLTFEALGLGLALPYVLLTLVPAWRRLLPRPGPWMVTLERLLALPLYASVAWLVWVVSRQAGARGALLAVAALALIALAAWLGRAPSASWRRAGVVGAIGLAALSVVTVSASPRERSASAARSVEPSRQRRLAELRAAGTPVFVNVTAAWCITCLVNERVALRSPAVAAVFARKGVVTLEADWTHRDPVITEVLGTFGRNGVPLYLLYPAGAGPGPTVLPQILSEGILVDATEKI